METWARECCRMSLSSNSGGRVKDNGERQAGNQDDVNRREGLLAMAQVDQKDVKNLKIAEVRSMSKLTAADKEEVG